MSRERAGDRLGLGTRGDIYHYRRIATIAVALATAGLLVWRMLRGTPAQRRAVAIGASVALVFTALQIAYQFLKLVAPGGRRWRSCTTRSLHDDPELLQASGAVALLAAENVGWTRRGTTRWTSSGNRVRGS